MPRCPGTGLAWFFWFLHSLDSVGRSCTGHYGAICHSLLSALGLIRMLPGTAFALACVEWAPLGIHGRAHAWAGTSQGQSGGDSSRQQGPLVSFSLLDLCSAMTSLLLWSIGGSQHHAGAQALMGRCSFRPERMVAHTENRAVSCGPSTVLSPPSSHAMTCLLLTPHGRKTPRLREIPQLPGIQLSRGQSWAPMRLHVIW